MSIPAVTSECRWRGTWCNQVNARVIYPLVMVAGIAWFAITIKRHAHTSGQHSSRSRSSSSSTPPPHDRPPHEGPSGSKRNSQELHHAQVLKLHGKITFEEIKRI